MKFHQQFFTVEKMCKIFKISSSSYYNWKLNIDGKRRANDEKLLRKIKDIHKHSYQIYGSTLIYNELKIVM